MLHWGVHSHVSFVNWTVLLFFPFTVQRHFFCKLVTAVRTNLWAKENGLSLWGLSKFSSSCLTFKRMKYLVCHLANHRCFGRWTILPRGAGPRGGGGGDGGSGCGLAVLLFTIKTAHFAKNERDNSGPQEKRRYSEILMPKKMHVWY